MWSPLTLLLIVGVAVAQPQPGRDHDHAWQRNNEYHYRVQTWTMTGLDKLKNQYSGTIFEGDLKIQVTSSPNVLRAELTHPLQLTRVHGVLSQDCCSNIPTVQQPVEYESDQDEVPKVEHSEIPTSELPFEIHLKHGVIRDVLVDDSLPIWEINILKSFISQLQLDTQGENIIRKKGNQIPDKFSRSSIVTFSTIEDSVGGECEVLYDIIPLSELTHNNHPELVPLPNIDSDGQFIDIIKTKNYSKCTHKNVYYFGTDGKRNQPQYDPAEDILERSSASRVVISGNLKEYTIQSSVTTSSIFVSPQLNNDYIGNVYGKVNLTLISRTEEYRSPQLPSPPNPVSTGNLVYLYNDLFSDNEEYKPRHPRISRTSASSQSAEDSDSSNRERRKSLTWTLSRPETDSRRLTTHEQDYFLQGIKKDILSKSPVLPLYVDFVHRSKFQPIDSEALISDAKKLAKEIADELHTPEDISSNGTLEKFTTLVNIIRAMNVPEIVQLEEHQFSGWKAQYFEDVIHDAVTQAGTGPALLTVRKWITSGKIRNFQAAQAISRIPKVARLPTPEYIREVFELIKEPIIQEQPFVNNTAPFAFGELLYISQVSETKRKTRYPVEMMSSMLSSDTSAVVNTYIPYLANQLRKAFEENNSARIQVYTLAVGKTGHPKILSIFEPYLEGKLPATKYQRQLIVASLATLAENEPNLARSVLYKIYVNPEEVQEVRYLALLLLIKTNPPVALLERIAQYTNYDSNTNVNSAVKTIIESLAELKDSPEWDLPRKARIAKNLLNTKEYNYRTSQERIIKNDEAILRDILRDIYTITVESIDSNDSNWPKAIYLASPIEDIVGNPKTEVSFAVSSIKQLWEKIKSIFEKLKPQQEPSPVEEIARILHLQPQEQDPLEGTFILNNMYGSQIYAADYNDITTVIDKLQDLLIDTNEVDRNYLYNYDMRVHFTTETGLPFIYTLEKPVLIQIQVNETRTGRNQPKFWQSTVKSSNAVQLTIAKNVMSRFGYVTPFDYEYYFAGIDTNTVILTPFTYDFQIDVVKNTMQLAFRPNTETTETHLAQSNKLFHRSNVPFTSRLNLLRFGLPVQVNEETRVVRVSKRKNDKATVNLDAITINVESDNEAVSKYNNFWSFFEQLIIDWSTRKNNHFETIDVNLNPLNINVVYSKKKIYSDAKLNDPWRENDWAYTSQLKTLTTPKERNELVTKEIGNSVQNPTVQAIDFTIDNLITQNRYIATLGLGNSVVDGDPKYESLLFVQTLENERTEFEICSGTYVFTTQTDSLDFNEAIEREPKDQYYFDLQFGRTCKDGRKFEVNGTFTRSPDLKRLILHSDEAKRCKNEMVRGHKLLQACREAIALAEQKNHLFVSIQPIENSVQFLASVIPEQLNIPSKWNIEADAENKTIEVEVNLSLDFTQADIAVRSPIVNINLPPIDIAAIQVVPILKKEVEQLWEEDTRDDGTCTVDKTQAITFDGKTYPIGQLGKCQHVMMTASPQWNANDRNSQPIIPSELRTAVIIEDQDDERKKVFVVLGDTQIDLEKPNDRVNVAVNKERVKLINKNYVVRRGRDVVAEITELPNRTVKLNSQKYEVNIAFDGKRIQVKASDKYRDSIRGICGNYDGQPDNDFVTPKNCIVREPKDFVALYALTEDNCKGSAVKNKIQAEQANCIREVHHPSDVISDREAGRPTTENKYWGYHWKNTQSGKHCIEYRIKTITNDKEICFTTKPLMKCINNCKPTEVKTKQIPVSCRPNTNKARQLLHRIEQGANPDMSQLSVSKTVSLELPLGCTAA